MYMASIVAPKFSVVAVIPRTTLMLEEVVKDILWIQNVFLSALVI